ncbi:MAG: dihydrolipoyl dehydrogenase [Candidatus Cloacimonetes bacterium]|nr:dihydrolipoyl dehydrogenase [Candidatus Cloacimonadota bacterium]
MRHYKTAIIGGGPGGYVTGLRLKRYNIETVVFEKERLGGVCLNWGCIPTKALVKVAELYNEIKESESYGLAIHDFHIDYSRVFERKNGIVEKLVSGIEQLYEKQQIPVIKKEVVSVEKRNDLYILTTEDQEQFSAEYIILATGSKPKELRFMPFDYQKILSSTDILKIDSLPKSLAVIGGGVIGCEFASIFNSFGVDVTIIEFLPQLVPAEDDEISKRLAVSLKKSGIKVLTKTAVEGFESNPNGLILKLSNGKELEVEKALVSVGREAVTGLEFKGCELKMDRGAIVIDDEMKTNLENVWAIGDNTAKLMLAHTASKQGLMVADQLNVLINNEQDHSFALDYTNIPRCTFTHPEIGSVGLTETQAIDIYGEVGIGKFPFSASGKAMAIGDTFGFVKTIADKKTGKLVGMHIIGPNATEMIAQGAILIGRDSTVKDVERIVFAHPTLGESVMESIEDIEGLSVHKL